MMRALWTGASGMKAQQTNVDTIANNIANVNTVGYKSQSTQFKSLLYQTLSSTSTSSNGDTKPTSAQVGLGTRVSSTNINFSQGTMTATESDTDFCISGEGFFAIQDSTGATYYTRAGSFTWALDTDGSRILTTASGEAVLDYDGNPITIPGDVSTESVSVASDGTIAYQDADGNYVYSGQQIALYQFSNPNGLELVGETQYAVTAASGDPMSEAETDGLTRSTVVQGYLEASNVDVADEMVNLIIAQRAYELNSKAITTADTMLEQANNLKR